ncbi:hypothetical protein J8V57_17895 [Xenorhabdus sp. PB61.4]|uniref:hypothetical protein n=1 Tax=Xenorhabdus sp. PB61.4 TaxID=2788940 RepID=UPI001E52CEFF|nr:hypothetical protein [Xenorhabdus sp. PB61.4]MCC8368102.1 hypothetical protein [Xenorhabdus sp. PB61.4]
MPEEQINCDSAIVDKDNNREKEIFGSFEKIFYYFFRRFFLGFLPVILGLSIGEKLFI